jgi:hypothetical protein
VATDSDGRILDGSVTIPAGANEADVIVYPLEDHTPRWTETVDITLTGGSSDYAIDDDNSAAGCYVVNDDLYAWLDNGSDNEILDGSSNGETSLVPLVLDLPSEERDGAEIVLTDNAASEADVYTTADPGPGDQPILGDVDGTYISSVTWTVGVSGAAPLGETTFHVGGTNGSASLNDISFEVNDDDSRCGPDGTDTDPVAPQDEEEGDVYATTTVSGSGNGATGISVEIFSLNDPNPDEPAGDVAGVQRDWLVGQMVDLEVSVLGPYAIESVGDVQWSIDGSTSPDTNVLYDYSDNNQTATQTPLYAIAPNADGTGMREPEVKFFWVTSGSSEDAVHTVSVQVKTFGLWNDGPLSTVSTEFDVFEPTASLEVTGQSSTSAPFINAADRKWTIGLGTVGMPGGPAASGGIEETGSVQLPDDFTSDDPGQWKFVQLVTPQETETIARDIQSRNFHNSLNGQTILDGDPVGIFVGYNGPATIATGSTAVTMTDSPTFLLQISANVYMSQVNTDDTFEDYLMFQPPSGADKSAWVPVEYQDWYWSIDVSGTGVGAYITNSARGPDPGDPFAVGSIGAEPLWTKSVKDIKWVPS